MEVCRHSKFTDEESIRLLELVDKYGHILHNPDKTSVKCAAKTEVWKLIAEEFNDGFEGPEERDFYQLRLRYKNMKRNETRMHRLTLALKQKNATKNISKTEMTSFKVGRLEDEETDTDETEYIVELISSDGEDNLVPVASNSTAIAKSSTVVLKEKTTNTVPQKTVLSNMHKSNQRRKSQHKTVSSQIITCKIEDNLVSVATNKTAIAKTSDMVSKEKSISNSLSASNESWKIQKEIFHRDEEKEEFEACVFGKNQTGALKNDTIPKILSPQQLLDAEFNKLLKEEEVLTLIREIAAERVRINEILRVCSIPNMNFSLYANHDMLKEQLDKRFKERNGFLKRENGSDSNNNNN